MDLLSWLFAGHMAGDFLFQTRWMAERKTAEYIPLILHSAIYACSVWFASLGALSPLAEGTRPLLARGLSFWGVLFVFVSHAVIDRRGITKWWRRSVTRSNSEWLSVAADQAFHVVALALACVTERLV